MNGLGLHRRELLKAAMLGSVGSLAAGRAATAYRSEGVADNWSSSPGYRLLVRFPQKAPMILLTDRAPQLETPLPYFLEDFVPNDALFVRSHFSGIPTKVNAAGWRLDVTGSVNRHLRLSLDDLRRRFEAVSVTPIIARCECPMTQSHLEQPTRTRAIDALEHGVPGTAMPSWTGQLSAFDRLLLSSYVRPLFAAPALPGKEQPRD